MLPFAIIKSQLNRRHNLKRTSLAAILGLLAYVAATAGHAAERQSAGRFDLAITVDDLPVHGALPRGQDWPGIARAYIATLKAHGVAQAWGFVNARRIAEQPASEAVLDDWRRAGYPLGNHSASHLGLSKAASLQAWEDDVAAGEAAIAGRMRGQDWRVLRYPFLDAGGDAARHDGAAHWLKGRGYRIADVSISFDDWAYTDTYARCLDKGDAAAVARMRTDYLKRVDQAIVRTRAMSQRVYGRVIPQVLLTHLGAWSAATLPEVLARLDAAGARYVPLEQAQGDPAYHEPSPHAGNGVLMERRARDAGISLEGLPAVDPVTPLEKLCR